MIKEIIMPKLGETMEEGYIVRWAKNEGDYVKKGEVLFEVMSDKTNFEIESLYEGYLRKILYPASDTSIAVITVIGYITDKPDEEIPEKPQISEKKVEPKQTEDAISKEAPIIKQEKKSVDEGRIKVSPVAKKLAEEMGISLSDIQGTGEGGRIEKKDVLYYAEILKSQGNPQYEVMQWTPFRKIIADKLTYSKQNIPHYYLSSRFLMDNITKEKEKKSKEKKITYTDFLIFWTARTIKDFPLLNAAVVNNQIRLYKTIDIGLAISIEDGLIVPIIKDVANKTIEEISSLRENIVTRAKNKTLSKEDMGEGARFVISNLGMFGVKNFSAIISPPGVAIMAVGTIEKEPIIKSNNITIAETMWVTLSLDHRIIDGTYGGKFLQTLQKRIENLEI
ncbi:MAG: 2-oxo acid dehydrogenase subunit E2 [Candidatus Omnitrophica bacterium]|jgi:pyruvate dehydrogenase E2 component (dihydrolipoamide acetyltransferase)|nr:2-oxo acid dehydrogenase subunit E2 [Candidatus Omnitrophota bacterium]